MYSYETLQLAITDEVAWVTINRPEKANALHDNAWIELKRVFENLDRNDNARVVILTGEGKHFCSGMDLSLLTGMIGARETCDARRRENLRKKIVELQSCVSSIEQCSKPVLAAISGGCIGAGLDIASTCDMRYASADSFFTIKELDLGMVADLGTLQRLPRLIPDGLLRELAFTGRNLSGAEAEKAGLVNQCLPNREALITKVKEIALVIASKSPVSVRGIKHILNYSRDHSVADGLGYVATWNAAMLLSDDLNEAFQAKLQGRAPSFDS